ncbi:shikimate dehydrogenase [Filibacter tadaridae]|uniref:Shikimate dehydrogenase (NADP(+)) n=1 Tax=Filibacter tadaridae TaxID=2483811 RepID=A0A3P5XU38_9BACL|nr:shikimate dehydrogenase [Filibacter tadaridae]VDC32552.1 Shikimate dehydrogenase [Filibacter tadaridae]
MKKWYAVIGDPIAQSMSPAMHDEWFAANEMDASYIPIHVTAERLEEAVGSLRTLGCSGWNVTVPHKQAIIPFLDRLDASAELMNAVNTVRVEADGSLVGFNTDGRGFVRALEESCGKHPGEGKVLLVGAGGAARGIAFALHAAGYGPLSITNRTLEKARSIAVGLPNASSLTITEAESSLSNFKLIVQTTTVGMHFAQHGMPFNPNRLAEEAIVADIIYNPLETEFLENARANGAETMNGIGMFVHQGALAFETWTGTYPNTKKMIEKITTILGGQQC